MFSTGGCAWAETYITLKTTMCIWREIQNMVCTKFVTVACSQLVSRLPKGFGATSLDLLLCRWLGVIAFVDDSRHQSLAPK